MRVEPTMKMKANGISANNASATLHQRSVPVAVITSKPGIADEQHPGGKGKYRDQMAPHDPLPRPVRYQTKNRNQGNSQKLIFSRSIYSGGGLATQ